jgi:hypothetical protein
VITPKTLHSVVWAAILWVIGFVWGSVGFTIWLLNGLPSIPYVSKYPAIGNVLLVLYVVLIIYISKKQIRVGVPYEWLRFGFIISISNFLLDLMVHFPIFNS